MAADVLIVDDELSMREILRSVVESMGLEAREAVNGLEALEQVSLKVPSLIILDLMMPRMDGNQVLALLKADPMRASIPVIVYTAQFLSESELESIPLPRDLILSKSLLTIDQIKAVIRRALMLE